MKRFIDRYWIAMVLVVVLTVSGLVIGKLHSIFGSDNPNAEGDNVEIVRFNQKVLTYEVFGSAGSNARIDYFDADVNTHEVNAALPWSVTITTTLPSVMGNIVVQGDGNLIGCRIIVDEKVQTENSSDGINPQTFCLVKAA